MTMSDAIAGNTKSEEYDKWAASEDVRHLTEANLIRKDKKRMANARRCAKEKLAEMAQLKELAEGK